jgi:hypothetical protein
LPLNNRVETPPISMTLKAVARTAPVLASTHTIIATAASASSTMMPAAPTRARCQMRGNAVAELASTYGTGNSTSNITPISCTAPPQRLQA